MDVTRNWLLLPRYWGIDVVPLSDVMWVHKKRTKHSVNFIPTGSTYGAVIWTRDGRMLEVAASEHVVDEYLHAMLAAAPWILAGYDEQLLGAWTHQRPAVIAAVDQRRSLAKPAE